MRKKRVKRKEEESRTPQIVLDWASICLKQCIVVRSAHTCLCYWIWILSSAQRHQSSRLINKKPAGRRRWASSQSVSPGKYTLMSSDGFLSASQYCWAPHQSHRMQSQRGKQVCESVNEGDLRKGWHIVSKKKWHIVSKKKKKNRLIFFF